MKESLAQVSYVSCQQKWKYKSHRMYPESKMTSRELNSVVNHLITGLNSHMHVCTMHTEGNLRFHALAIWIALSLSFRFINLSCL